MATAGVGWYGPLIDLSEVPSHVNQLVQLLVFVHRFTPLQFRQSKGGQVIRTDLQVGDDTKPFFSVTLWGTPSASTFAARDIVLLQNVKIMKYGSSVVGKTVNYSSLLCLVDSEKSHISEGVDNIIKDCHVGIVTKEKLRRVIEWVQRVKPKIHTVGRRQSHQENGKFSVNWKEPEETKFRHCSSLAEVAGMEILCRVRISASIGDIFLPCTSNLGATGIQNMFVSQRIYEKTGHNLPDDLICTGCSICGSPLGANHGYHSVVKRTDYLHCPRSYDRLHAMSSIYRPFMLYVWDETDYIPLLVKNMAATILFGNLKAEEVYISYKVLETMSYNNPSNANENKKNSSPISKNENEFLIWLILLRVLLKQGKNSPMVFEVTVNSELDKEDGRFEMTSVSFPCFN